MSCRYQCKEGLGRIYRYFNSPYILKSLMYSTAFQHFLRHLSYKRFWNWSDSNYLCISFPYRSLLPEQGQEEAGKAKLHSPTWHLVQSSLCWQVLDGVFSKPLCASLKLFC